MTNRPRARVLRIPYPHRGLSYRGAQLSLMGLGLLVFWYCVIWLLKELL